MGGSRIIWEWGQDAQSGQGEKPVSIDSVRHYAVRKLSVGY
jgi:hypothetical protein